MIKVKLPVSFNDGKSMYAAVLAIINKKTPILAKMIHDNKNYKPFSLQLPNIICVLTPELEPAFEGLEVIERADRTRCLLSQSPTLVVGPTTFRTGGASYPLPDPYKVVEGLKDRWNQLFPDKISLTLRSDSRGKNFLRIQHANIHACSYPIDTDKYTAFQGTFSIKAHGSDIFKREVYRLLAFAEYAGVGIKTQMGMGVCEIKV